MTIDDYLDRICQGLRLDPAQTEEIRAELGAHLEELVEAGLAEGLTPAEAAARAGCQFGDVSALRQALARVHRGEPWWVQRLRGLAVGGALGGAIGLGLRAGASSQALSAMLGLSWTVLAPERLLLSTAAAGALIGLCSAGGRFLVAGLLVGSLVWLGQHVVCWVCGVISDSLPPEQALAALNGVLLSPLVGGLFGLVVGMGSAILVALASRLRPERR